MVYQVINKILAQSEIDSSAAEAHGMATGMLCVNSQTTSVVWLNELFRDVEPLPDEQLNFLARLFDETSRLMSVDEFEFDMLLPDDEISLTLRIGALKNWCQGFLYGVGTFYSDNNCPKEAAEILKDITEFTRLETETEGEDDEFAFMEVTEYLRSAVLLLRDELTDTNQNTLH